MLRAHSNERGIRFGMLIRSEFAPLFDGHSAVDRVHTLAKRAPGSTTAIIREIKATAYDVALIPHRSFRSAWIASRSGIGRRIGFNVNDAPWLLTDRLRYNIVDHEVERNARLLVRAGIRQSDVRPWLEPSAGDIDRVREQFAGNGAIIVVAPGSVWPTKRWTLQGFAEVAQRVRQLGGRVIVIGSASEQEVCREVASQGGVPDECVAAGTLTLGELVALISISARIVANDSAPVHIASAMGIPATVLYGPTVPGFGFAPIASGSTAIGVEGLSCRPCSIHGQESCPLRHHMCMSGIKPGQVLGTMGPPFNA